MIRLVWGEWVVHGCLFCVDQAKTFTLRESPGWYVFEVKA